ncbi:unnamed protein product [Cylindrotheca closterium]|uniref:Reverse transcriptase Ty1/copia-type domain-containing protein n=1 Tax=Cylindrotheca closterium TaxID=2856 RepID=A0AAD2FRM2_9STRA|nr:unnamed protein product [Cylindrotheca closterium]
MPGAKEGEDRIYMKITGMMVQILIDMAPEYCKYVVFKNGKRVIYVQVLHAIYGMLQSSLLFYNQLQSDLEAKGFVFDPYDPCFANKVDNEKQQTIRFHVDDVMSSHMDPKVDDKFAEWLNMRYGSIKACTIIRGKIHRYLGMTLDFLVKGKLKIRMGDYDKNMLEAFPIKFNKDSKQETPAGNNLLEAGKGKLLGAEYRQIFHTTVARGLYVSKKARLDIHPTITILALRVREPTESDWKNHMDPKVDDKFAEWLNMRYGSIKACTIIRGKIHRYLGMTLDFLVKGKLKIRMGDYDKNMLEAFPIKFNKDSKQETPAGNNLLEAGKGKLLSAEYCQIFHTTVARGLYVSKRACLDIHPTITILASRV